MRLVVLMALPLAACATAGMPVTAPSMVPGKCVSGSGSGLIGLAIAKVPQSEIMRVTGAVTVRIVRPGEVVTMDHREDRVTVSLDEKDVIERVSCG